MLDLGFLPDIEKIMKMLPEVRQTLLFSATMPGPIVALARTFLNQPVQIRAEHAAENTSTDHIDQFAYRAHSMDKVELLARILQANKRGLDADLRPHQALGSEGHRRPHRTRVRGWRRARRPRPGRTRAGAAGVPFGQGGRARRHRRRCPRARRRRHHPRHQLPGPRRRDDLRAPDRAHGPCRRVRAPRSPLSTGTTSLAGG